MRLIDADALKAELLGRIAFPDWVREAVLHIIDNAPTVEVPENAVNCVLTMYGKCSYNETGCSDCEIKNKIRKALNADKEADKEAHDGCN